MFCFAYIKVYCDSLIKIHITNKNRNINTITNKIKKSKPLCKMILIYIYKICYSKGLLKSEENATEFGLDELFNLNNFIDNIDLINPIK